MSDFRKERPVKKDKMRGKFRLIGLIVPSMQQSDMVLGYVIIDMSNFKIIQVIPEQFIMMLKNYTFENVKLNSSSRSIESTDTNVKDYKKKMMRFNRNLKLIGDFGYNVLAKVIMGNEVKYRVLIYDSNNGNLVPKDLSEEMLVNLIDGDVIPLYNAKIVGGGISALKDNFSEIYVEVKQPKEKSKAQTKEAHERHLEKILNRFKRSVIDMSRFTTFNVVDTFPSGIAKDKAHNRFMKDLKIFYKEYAEKHNSNVIEIANSIYGETKGKEVYEKLVSIMITIMFYDTFVNKKYSIERPFVGLGREWVKEQLMNSKCKELIEKVAQSSGNKDLANMINIINLEQIYLIATERELGKKDLIDSSYYPRAHTSSRYREIILNETKNKIVIEIYKLYKEIGNKELKRYLSLLPVCETLEREETKRIKAQKKKVLVKLNMKTQKGIKSIGFCVNPKEDGLITEVNKLYKNKPLRYVLGETNISLYEQGEIIKQSTCFGDMAFSAKLLKLKENGIYELRKNIYIEPYYDSTEEEIEVVNLVIESIMIILAVYNLDLALYLNEKYNFVDLDLESIGREYFPLDDKDKIYYQTGGKFNKGELVVGEPWRGLSKMPMGLRNAISLNATNSVPLELEYLLNYLYIQ